MPTNKIDRHPNPCIVRHVIEKTRERYDIEITPADYWRVTREISNFGRTPTNAQFLSRISSRQTLWMVNFLDHEVLAIYNRRMKGIVTVIPQDCRNDRSKQIALLEADGKFLDQFRGRKVS